MSGLHRKPSLDTLAHLAKDVTARAAHLPGKLTRQTLTRVTGGVAVGAALIAGVAATASVSENGVSRSGPGLAAVAAANQESTNDFLAAEPKAEPAKPMVKVRRAPTLPKHKQVKAEDVIKLAEKQVGIAETDGQGGGTKFQDWYATTNRAKQTMQRDGGGSTGEYKDAAWCVMFLSWIGNQLDFNDQIGSDAWTIAHAQWFKDKGRWGATPKPGAVVYFDWDGGKSIQGIDHVGLVTKVNGDGTMNTVEGNISDSVVSKTRTLDKVVGFGYPDYAK